MIATKSMSIHEGAIVPSALVVCVARSLFDRAGERQKAPRRGMHFVRQWRAIS